MTSTLGEPFSRLNEKRIKSDSRIQTRLSRRTRSEEISIDGFQITIRVDDNQAQNAENDNPRICEELGGDIVFLPGGRTMQGEKVYRWLPHAQNWGCFTECERPTGFLK